MKILFTKTAFVLLAVSPVVSSCSKHHETSQKTGITYNDKTNGGYVRFRQTHPSPGPGLVPIEGGTFVMGGSADQDVAYDYNNVKRRVTVPSFYMDETEVSNQDWLDYLHWTAITFPNDRELYYDALPDTLVWRKPLSYNDLGTYTPNEFSIDASFARKFGENLSLGLTMRYIRSSISSISFAQGSGQVNKPGNAVAADVSLFYKKPYGENNLFAFGAHISNIGTKISYSDVGPKYFLPTNLKLGVANTWELDETNELTATFDINKLLVPTPPIRDANGNIIKGHDDDVSVPAGIFQSFGDAPGGFSEELKEISFSPGVEYWYNHQFAVRAGYFYENPDKGDRHYLTLGLGMKYNIFNFDFSYLAASQQNSPLANTLRFTLSANFGGITNVGRR